MNAAPRIKRCVKCERPIARPQLRPNVDERCGFCCDHGPDADEVRERIAELQAQSFMLNGGGAVWVDAPDALEPGWARLQ